MVKEGDIKIEEDVYARKDNFGWRLIFPHKHPNGKINWKNFLLGGNWGNLLKTIIVVLFLMFLVYLYRRDTATLVECCKNCKGLIPFP